MIDYLDLARRARLASEQADEAWLSPPKVQRSLHVQAAALHFQAYEAALSLGFQQLAADHDRAVECHTAAAVRLEAQ